MRHLPFAPALALADAVLRLGGSRAELLADVATGRGCRHSTEAARRATPEAESPDESWVRAIILQNDLPLPRLQVEFFDDAGFVARTDSLLGGGTPQRRLEALGFRVLRFTAADVHDAFILAGRLRHALGGRWVDHGLSPEAKDLRRWRGDR